MRVTVRIPLEPLCALRTLRFVVESLTYLAGGTTVNEGRGSWVDNDGDIVYNRVWTVEAYSDAPMGEKRLGWEVYKIAEEAMHILEESTVMYTVNDKPYFT